MILCGPVDRHGLFMDIPKGGKTKRVNMWSA